MVKRSQILFQGGGASSLPLCYCAVKINESMFWQIAALQALMDRETISLDTEMMIRKRMICHVVQNFEEQWSWS